MCLSLAGFCQQQAAMLPCTLFYGLSWISYKQILDWNLRLAASIFNVIRKLLFLMILSNARPSNANFAE